MSEHDPKELERVLRKIKHCLALSASSNEHEAAAAMRQARKLMEKYRLTEADVQLSDVSETRGAKSKAVLPAWDRDLACIVAQAFNCRAFTHEGWDGSKLCRQQRSTFIGVSPAPEIAKYAYDTLHTKVTAARREFIAKIRSGAIGRGRYTPETRGNHFAEAWVLMIHEKLQALVPEPDETPEQALSNSQALAVVRQQENELIEAFVKQITNGAGAKKSKAGKGAQPNLIDLIMGMEEGKKAQIHQGLYTGGAETFAIGGAGS